MKKIFTLLFLTAAAITLASCNKNEMPSPWNMQFDVVASTENVRPVAYVTFNNPDYFYPCQVKVDGKIFSENNHALTTIQNVSGTKVTLPYLTPGKHQIEFIVGKGRKLYRDAENAWGENEASYKKEVIIENGSNVTFVLKNNLVDMDWGYWVPEKGIKEQRPLDCGNTFAIQIFPFSLNNEFSIENVSPEIKVEKTKTILGDGIITSFTGSERKSKYYFDIVANGVKATVELL